MRVKFLPLLFVAGKFASFLGAAHRPEGRFSATRSKAIARQGMVAAAHPLAVLVGVSILQRGGTAVDAAIADNAALAFIEPVALGATSSFWFATPKPKSFTDETAHGGPQNPSHRSKSPQSRGNHSSLHTLHLERPWLRRQLVCPPPMLW